MLIKIVFVERIKIKGTKKMDELEEKVIEINKGIISIAIVLGCFTIAAIGFLTIRTYGLNNNFSYVGVLLMIVFVLSGAAGGWRLISDKPALILNAAGITDNASMARAGLIPWPEIIGINLGQYNKQKIIIISVSNPEKYFSNDVFALQGEKLKSSLNEEAFKTFGSPIVIGATSLKMEPNTLIEFCRQYHRRYGKEVI